jgi:hypothetical protein
MRFAETGVAYSGEMEGWIMMLDTTTGSAEVVCCAPASSSSVGSGTGVALASAPRGDSKMRNSSKW